MGTGRHCSRLDVSRLAPHEAGNQRLGQPRSLCQDEMVRGVRGWRDPASPGRHLSSSSRFVFFGPSKVVRDSIPKSTGRRDSEQRWPHSELRWPNPNADVEFESRRRRQRRHFIILSRPAAVPKQPASSLQFARILIIVIGGQWRSSSSFESIGVFFAFSCRRGNGQRTSVEIHFRRQHAAKKRRWRRCKLSQSRRRSVSSFGVVLCCCCGGGSCRRGARARGRLQSVRLSLQRIFFLEL